MVDRVPWVDGSGESLQEKILLGGMMRKYGNMDTQSHWPFWAKGPHTHLQQRSRPFRLPTGFEHQLTKPSSAENVATVGLWVTWSNMRPWRGDCFSHLRYARHVSIASIICMATAPVFGSSFELFSLRAILFFSRPPTPMYLDIASYFTPGYVAKI